MKEFFLKMRFNLAERRLFYEIMSSYLDSNVPLADALEAMFNRADKDKDYKAYIYKDILNKMGSGKSPSEALSKWVPPNELMLIEAGEKGAKLSESFKEAVYMAESITKIKKIVTSNMITPFIMIILLFGMIVGYRIGMVPIFLDLIPLEKWTPNALTVYDFTNFVYEYWIIFVGGFLGLTLLVFGTINNFTGPVRTFLDRLPPYNVYKKFVESSFLITFASLLKAKYPIMTSLRSMNANATKYLSYYLEKMMENVARGSTNEGAALNVGLLNKHLAGILEDTSKLANFEVAVHNMGKRNIDKSIAEVTAIMKSINSFLLVTILGVTIYMFFSIQELSMGISQALGS